jgi:hypothetical protein
MSEFGLELPLPTAKLGVDGKGGKAYIVKQSGMKTIFAVVAVLLVLCGCLALDIQAQRTTFTSSMTMEHSHEEHQRIAKVEAETKLAEMSAKIVQLNEKSKDQESDLKIMASHLQYIQQVSLIRIMKHIDNENLTVADIKHEVKDQFESLEKETEQILHDHLVVVEGANAKSNAEMDRIEREVAAMTEREEKYDVEQKKDEKNAAPAQLKIIKDRVFTNENKEIEDRINVIFTHVYDLAEKMGDADIDGLLDANKVAEWEQVLTDAENGKLAYPKAVEKMEEIITKAPAALKLAEVTNTFQLIEEDGGAKGVTEVTNFRNLLKEVKWLPQYAAVLEELSQWKQGTKTVQQVLAWTEGKLAAGEIDGTWLAKAYETTTKAGAAAATATTPGTASTSNAAAAAAVATKAAPAATATTAAKAAQRDM